MSLLPAAPCIDTYLKRRNDRDGGSPQAPAVRREASDGDRAQGNHQSTKEEVRRDRVRDAGVMAAPLIALYSNPAGSSSAGVLDVRRGTNPGRVAGAVAATQTDDARAGRQCA